jgi:GntR family transcriptional regulator, transcriptional repressor for pyruvate dehydrogenase complex
MLKPIPPPQSSVDACEGRLKEAILLGELPMGEALPPERRLAEDLGVNRVTVRSALGRLVASRLVDVRQGAGYKVRDFKASGGPDLLAMVIQLAVKPKERIAIARDLLAIRRALAKVVLERSIERMTKKNLQAVRLAVKTFVDATESGSSVEELAEADLAIIQTLVDTTDSITFRLFLNPVGLVLGRVPKLRAAIYSDPKMNALAYTFLLDILKNKDKEALQQIFSVLEERDEHTLRMMENGK